MVTQEELEKMSPEEIAQLQKDNCIFCKIIRGEIPSKKVYEDNSVIAILDINPARKGHVLVMPKDHFPILPLIPKDVFEKIFLATKLISHGVRKAMLVKETTIFIANGAIAGQQSPHFLFHIFPRDQGDGLNNFDLQENPSIKDEQQSLEPSLKEVLNSMFSGLFPSLIPSDSKSDNSIVTPAAISPETFEKKYDLIAKIIEEHEDVRNALIDDPVNFKKQLVGNPQLEKLFEGIDLKTLSEQLKPSFSKEEPSSSNEDPVLKLFLGSDPVKQRDAVFEYFESKPKAKQLLIDDPAYFKELLKNRSDVNELFIDVNIDLLSVKLKEMGANSDE